MATIGVKLRLLTCYRSCIVSCVRQRSDGLTRKIYGTYKSNEEYEAAVREKKEKRKKTKDNPKTEPRPQTPISDEVKDLRYENLGKDTKNKFASLMYNLKTSRYRHVHGVCALHGKQVIKDAIESGSFIRSIYFSNHNHLEDLPIEVLSKTNLFLVSQNVMDKFAEKKVEGIYALVSQQDQTTRRKIIDKRTANMESIYIPVTLICTGILDANLMGEVLNTASISGCKEIYVTEGCVDIWNMEVLKSAKGAHFKIPIHPSCEWDKIEKTVGGSKPKNLFLASEKPGEVTLNDFVSQSQYRKIATNSEFFRDVVPESNIERDRIDLAQAKLSCIPYHEMLISQTSNVFMVGKLDYEAFHFAARMQALGSNCVSVTLPMTSSSDRTSVVTQTSVLLFEARRQVLLNMEKLKEVKCESSVTS